MRRCLIGICSGVLLLTSGCATPTRRSEPPPPACTKQSVQSVQPGQSGPAFSWPAPMPSDLPLPRGATLSWVQRWPNGLIWVQFTSPASLHDSLLFAISSLQRAGYTLGRGSDGPTEIHVPFAKNDVQGVVRLVAVNGCNTSWQVEV